MTLLLFLVLAHWTPVDAWQYFKYWGENGHPKSIEQPRAAKTNPHPSVYHFYAPPTPLRTVCPVENRPGVFWYTPDGKSLNHTFVTPNPSEFNVSALQSNIHGFSVDAAFAGSAATLGAVETVYFADRACSDGTVEYGFSRDLATNSVLVYWSTFANCANDALSLCRKTDDPSLGANFSNVQQENGSSVVDHGFRIYGLDTNSLLTYRFTIQNQTFRIEVLHGATLARCSDHENAAAAPCRFEKPIPAWFPVDKTRGGYIVVGTQTAADPHIAPSSEFRVSGIVVAKRVAKRVAK